MTTTSMPRTVVLLGVPFHDVTMQETVDRMATLIAERTPVYWATANLDFTYQASCDVELQRILLEADLVLCDGTPLIWASRWLGAPLRERVAGSDLVPRLAAESVSRGWRLFLLGGGEDALPEALRRLREQYPGIQVDGWSPPYAKLLDMDMDTIRQKVITARPDVLLVAFGCPKQEKWIYMHHHALGVPVSIGVGATVDFLAGKFSRAPRWMQAIGAEWLYRLMQEPRRLFNRYVMDLFFFVRALRAQRRALSNSAAKTTPTPTHAPAPGYPQVAAWSGRVDASAVTAKTLADPVAASDDGPIVLDLSAVTFMDSTGLGYLLSVYRRAVGTGRTFHLLRPSKPVADLLATLKLARLMPSIEDVSKVFGNTGGTGAWVKSSGAGELVIALDEDPTARNADVLLRAITARWEASVHCSRLVLNLERVHFIDSTGLGMLLRARKMTMQRPGASFGLQGVGENVSNVIRMAKVGSILGLR